MPKCSICGGRRGFLSGNLHASVGALAEHVERIDLMQQFLPRLASDEADDLTALLSEVRHRAETWVSRLHPGVHGERQGTVAFREFVQGTPEGESFEQLVVDATTVDALGLNMIAEALEVEPRQRAQFLALLDARGGTGFLGRV